MNVKTTKLPHEFASIVGGTTETYIAIYSNDNKNEDKKKNKKKGKKGKK